jgi:uncharacterized protein YdeI (YjbR/CyaY-like superfamily)
MDVTFFETPSAFRAWLREHHADVDMLWVGFYKKATGRPSIDWPQSVDEALCFGWIDGLRKSIDDESYRIRFTPRRPGSVWSARNIQRAEELTRLGRMEVPGLAAYGRRSEEKSRRYSFDQTQADLGAEMEAEFRRHAEAWAYFQSQPPGYRRTSTRWVIQAQRPETRTRRLAELIRHSAAGERLPQLRRPTKRP